MAKIRSENRFQVVERLLTHQRQRLRKIPLWMFGFCTSGRRGDALEIVRRRDDVSKLVKLAIERYGKLDVLVNNAGVAPISLLDELRVDDWEEMIDVNLKGVWLCLKYELRQMIKQGSGGTIVNMSSVAGLISSQGAATYCASKHANLGYMRALAKELGPKGIRVNAVAPGIIKTPMHAPETHAFLAGLHPLGRMGEVREIVEAVLYLESAAFVTGETVHVDGGAHAGQW